MKEYLPNILSSAVLVSIIEFIRFLVTRVFQKNDAKNSKQSAFESQINKDIASLNAALQMSLRNEIRQLCRKHIREGEIDFDERSDLLELHQAYHNLGGNGNLDADMATVKDLPIKTNYKN